jgi:mono/diheme cytochrome c family protein
MSPLWALAAAAILAAAGCASAPNLPPVRPQIASAFAPASIRHGAALAKAGDCQTCHTADGGAPYAGGRPIGTPFGAVFATNITPDVGTGIGAWSPQAFARAMRQGLRRDGAHLYPAFPYDHFTRTSDADIADLYAFLMTRRAVAQATPPPQLVPPLGFRPLMGIWKALFFRPGPFVPRAGESAEWNRGAYLAESLGHCGACHTPHNWLGAEKRKQAFAGGWAEGWYAPPLNAATPAITPWTEDRLFTYLRTGLDLDHAAAAGPMGPVAHELARASDADVRAMAVYLASQMRAAPAAKGAPPDRMAEAAQAHPEGATLYAGACATCHDPGGGMMQQGRPPLELGTPLHEDDPRDTIQIVLQGLQPPVRAAGPFMPAFGDSLSDGQVAELAAYLRTRFSDRPAWRGLPGAVAKARKEAAG